VKAAILVSRFLCRRQPIRPYQSRVVWELGPRYIFPLGALACKCLIAKTLAYLPSYLQALVAVFLLMCKLSAISP